MVRVKVLLSSDICTLHIAGGHTCEDSSLIAYYTVLPSTYRHFRGTLGGTVGHKPEGRGYDYRWCPWIFLLKVWHRNDYQEYFRG